MRVRGTNEENPLLAQGALFEHSIPTLAVMAETQNKLAAQVLIVDDEPDHADVMADALRKPGHVCTIVNTVEAALDELRHGAFDVIITDLRMSNSAGTAGVEGADDEVAVVAMDGANAGLVVLAAAKSLQRSAETVMVTAHGDVPTARSAFKHGVYDFIEKPLDLEVFRSLINRAAETVLLRHESGELQEKAWHSRRVLALDVARFGPDASVLCDIQGPIVREFTIWRGASLVESAAKVVDYGDRIAAETFGKEKYIGRQAGTRPTVYVD